MTIATDLTKPDLAGPRGQRGELSLRAAPVGDRTRLVEVLCRPPLQVLRAAYPETALPDLAAVTICSPSGGVLQGDRLRMEIAVDSGARLRLETQSATRVYATPDGWAASECVLRLAAGTFLEYMPDPLIPYAGADYRQESIWEVEESATLIVGEVIGAGREARGERGGYRRVETRVEARRSTGQVIFRDGCRLVPDRARDLGLLGEVAAIGSLFVLSAGFRAAEFSGLRQDVSLPGGQAGWSDLPSDAGAWFKVLAQDSATAAAAVRAAWKTARRALIACDLPPVRRF